MTDELTQPGVSETSERESRAPERDAPRWVRLLQAFPVNLGTIAGLAGILNVGFQEWRGALAFGMIAAFLGMMQLVKSWGDPVGAAVLAVAVVVMAGGFVSGLSLDRLINRPATGNHGQALPNPSTTANSSSPSGPNASTTVAGAPGSARFSGDILLNSSRDFDKKPPAEVGGNATAHSQDDLSYFANVDEIVAFWPSALAKWDSPGEPSVEQCVDTVGRLPLPSSHRLPFREFAKGASFCLRTSEGRYAFIRVDGVTGEGHHLFVIVWETP